MVSCLIFWFSGWEGFEVITGGLANFYWNCVPMLVIGFGSGNTFFPSLCIYSCFLYVFCYSPLNLYLPSPLALCLHLSVSIHLYFALLFLVRNSWSLFLCIFPFHCPIIKFCFYLSSLSHFTHVISYLFASLNFTFTLNTCQCLSLSLV